MTDTKATLAEEGLRVERPSGWYWVKHHYLPNDWLPAEWSLKHKCWFSRACRIVYDSDFTAIGQRIFPPDHPTPPAVEASDLVEKVARAQCEAHGLDPDALLRDPTPSISS